MCNTSLFQQKRHFGKVAEKIGLQIADVNQLSPKKFEVVFNDKNDLVLGRREVWHFFFTPMGVKSTKVNERTI